MIAPHARTLIMTAIGYTIMSEVVSGSLNATEVYTPWMPRMGNNMTNVFEVIAIGGTDAQITVDVLEKNSEDTGEGTVKSAVNNSRTSTGVTSFRLTDCKELVRYRIKLGTQFEPSGTYKLHVHFRVLAPSWETTGAQGV